MLSVIHQDNTIATYITKLSYIHEYLLNTPAVAFNKDTLTISYNASFIVQVQNNPDLLVTIYSSRM